jgi:rhamnosyltransferase subunit B
MVLLNMKIRAFIFAAGSDGDIHPHLGLGSELAARGHEVLFLTSFDYLDLATVHGFEALSIIDPCDKEDFESAKNQGSIAKIRTRCNFFSRKVAAICELVASRLDERTVLVSPPFACPIAKLLHLRYRVPYVSTVLSPASLCSLRNPPAFKFGEWFASLPWQARRVLFRGLEYLIVDPGFRWLLRDILRSMQVPAPHRVISNWSFSPQKILGLFPEWFCPRAQDWPPQLALTGFPLHEPSAGEQELPVELRCFLDAGSAPVVFTAGTETKTVRSFFDIALRTAQSLRVRAIFLTRLGDQVPIVPASIYHANYVSLQSLLPHAAAIVHHGGIGTVAQAMRAGVPQLALPGRLDQFDNAKHVEALGCGLVQKDLLDIEGTIEKLRRLLHYPEVAHACRTLRDRIPSRRVACSRAVDLIEESSHLGVSLPLPRSTQGTAG